MARPIRLEHDEGVFYGAEITKSIVCVSSLQTYRDLCNLPERAVESGRPPSEGAAEVAMRVHPTHKEAGSISVTEKRPKSSALKVSSRVIP